MKRIIVLGLTVFIGMASVRCSFFSVTFTLENKEEVHEILPQEAFAFLESSVSYSQALMGALEISEDESQKSAKEIALTLNKLQNREEYNQFKSFWCPESELVSLNLKNKNTSENSLTADQFYKFLDIANFLGIQGEYSRRFGENMVLYGLFGKHSEEITSLDILKDCLIFPQLAWNIFTGFLNRMDLQYRIIDTNADKSVVAVEAQSTNDIRKEYKEFPKENLPLKSLHIDLYSSISKSLSFSGANKRNKSVFQWLLKKIGCASIDLKYPKKVSTSILTDNLKHQIIHLSETYQDILIAGATLSFSDTKVDRVLNTMFQVFPSLSRLHIIMSEPFLRGSIFSNEYHEEFCIEKCNINLENLEISGIEINPILLKQLLYNHPGIKVLKLDCMGLESDVGVSFAKCPQLTMLRLGSTQQSIEFYLNLLPNIPSIQNLHIYMRSTTEEIAEALKSLIYLEVLKIVGVYKEGFITTLLNKQPSGSLQSLKFLEFILIFSQDINITYSDQTAIEDAKKEGIMILNPIFHRY
ncbi:hypothetical protein NECID01_1873 [Nematocida sp. AWRm77]|nr:hypothetical protein NECID01_1873 [Nematocida sp. AWRm77]